MQKLYCTIFIVDVSQNPEEVETITSRIIQLIEDHGGVIKRHNPWGKQRLAYPIRKKTSGFYVEIEFMAHSHLNIPKIIEQEYRLNDRVLRYLTYVVTKEELKQRELNAKRAKTMGGEVPTPTPTEPEKEVKVEDENEELTQDVDISEEKSEPETTPEPAEKTEETKSE
ncbi:MAG: 30S ribosomal protein S6 [Calditrichaeota bacterium]|nr:MAG: 30S ribosomal protein S6 [Calditrichota bacterium]